MRAAEDLRAGGGAGCAEQGAVSLDGPASKEDFRVRHGHTKLTDPLPMSEQFGGNGNAAF